MAELHLFRALPTELRLEIWDMALEDEAFDRLVILFHPHPLAKFRVMPLKHLISPFLSVNQESRERALGLYNVKLDIYAVPEPEPEASEPSDEDEPPDSQDLGHYANQFLDEIYASDYHNLEGDYYDVIEDIETAVEPRGAIFVSTWADHFVWGEFLCVEPFCLEKANLEIGRTAEAWDMPLYHISGELTPDVCQQVRMLVSVQIKKECGVRTDYTEKETKYRWETDVFTGIVAFLHLWLEPGEPRHKVIHDVAVAGGRGELPIRLWQQCRAEKDGNVGWKLLDVVGLLERELLLGSSEEFWSRVFYDDKDVYRSEGVRSF